MGAGDYKAAFVLTDEQREQVNMSPFAVILGEIRTTTADLLWIKTERYLHRGVGFAPHINADELAHTGNALQGSDDAKNSKQAVAKPANAVQEKPDADAEHDPVHAAAQGAPQSSKPDPEAHPKPLVPDAEEDYRGFIGVLQRNVQPWQSASAPHHHEPGDELLPWYRVLTLSDPHHVRGYLTGSWWLMKQERAEPGAMAEALAFVTEGIANNPKDFQLPLMRGRILLQEGRVKDAIASFRQSARLALAIRPPGGVERQPDWTYWEEEDFSAAVHYVPTLSYFALRDAAATRSALAWAEKLLPGDKRLAELHRRWQDDPSGAKLGPARPFSESTQ
jgi:hypothetical protein